MRRLALVLVLALTLGGFAPAARADHNDDAHSDNMSLVGSFDDKGAYEGGTDLAFWGDVAVAGNLSPGGFRLLDISSPRKPAEIGQFDCNGSQSDVAIFRDLVFLAIDGPRATPKCDAPSGFFQQIDGSAWEGVRVVSMADPANPRQIAAVDTDCGAHTLTLVPDKRNRTPAGRPAPRALVYALSYPLVGHGEDCNDHRKISVVSVPLKRPARARVVSTPDVSPAIGCHDVTVFRKHDLAGAACISESQMWDISDPENPEIIGRIRNPLINIHHSTSFSWDADTLVIGDELTGATVTPGCLTPGNSPLGALWFYDVSDPTSPQLRGFFQMPQVEASALCTAHNYNVVPLKGNKDILTIAWDDGGTHVIDFTDPANPEQVGYYIPREGVRGSPWSSYWYNGFIYANNRSRGGESRGVDVFTIDDPRLAPAKLIDLPRLNPQTQEGPAARPS